MTYRALHLASILAAVLFAARGATAALLPRTSPTPATYYHVPYICPDFADTSVTHQPQWGIDLGQGSIACEYFKNGGYYALCKYYLTDGSTFIDSYDVCPAKAKVNTGGGLGCAKADTAGALLGLLEYYDGTPYTLSCFYNTVESNNGWHWYQCIYDRSSGVLTSGQRTTCPSTLGNTNAQTRRQYKGEDNLTALMRRRAEQVNAPQPAAVPAPIRRRKESAPVY